MDGLIKRLTIAATVFLVGATVLAALYPRGEIAIYIDDVSVVVDGKTLYSEDFTEVAENRLVGGLTPLTAPGLRVGPEDAARYSDDEYASPPQSLGVLRYGDNGIRLLATDHLPPEWSNITVSFKTRLTGAPPPSLWCNIIFDHDTDHVSVAMVSIGNRDLASGPCRWMVEVHGNYQQDFKEGNILGFNWYTWHAASLAINKSTSTFTFDIDSKQVIERDFRPDSGDSFAITWN